MKKLTSITLIFLILITLSGCTRGTEYINLDKKPSKTYYTDNLLNDISSKSYTIKVLDMNMYKETSIDSNTDKILNDFFSYMKDDYYLSSLPEDEDKIQYKMYVQTSSSKYIINIYSENSISIQPWDGNFIEDYISQKEIPVYYNLYEYCKYLFSQAS